MKAVEDQKARYGDIWRLAPRNELVIERDITSIFIGQTLRFMIGLNERYETVIVTYRTLKTITGTIECGPKRSETGVFQISEIALSGSFRFFTSPQFFPKSENP